MTCTAWTPHGHHGTSRGARGLRQGAGGAPWGPGDLLMSFLGVVILHFGFRIHAQRRLMMRHGPEILGSTAASALFSLFATAVAARAAGLVPGARRGPPCRLIPDPRDRGAREGGPRDCGAPGRALRRRHVLRRARLAGLLRVPATLQDPAALPRLCGRVRDSGSTAMAGPQR